MHSRTASSRLWRRSWPAMPEQLSSLSIAVACYNEEATILEVVDQSAETAARLAREFKVLVVDDGSRDKSREILLGMASSRPWLEIRFHEENLGFGGTFTELYTYEGCEFNAIMSGDGQFPPDQLEKMAPALIRADLVLGKRRARQDPFRRKFTSYIYNVLVSCLAARRVYDVNSISIARTSMMRRVNLTAASAFLHAELYLECYRLGGRIAEVEIDHKPRLHGDAQGNKPKVMLSTGQEFLAYVRRKGPAWRPASVRLAEEKHQG